MAATRQESTQDWPAASPDASPKRTRLIVRRGSLKRLEALKEKTAHLQVDVLWDRREHDRRAATARVDDDRRRSDRRKPPSFTWETADFTVVVEPEGSSPK